jgi:hypothetical protein
VLSNCVSYISMNGPGPGAHRSGLVTGFYNARYIVVMFVTGFPNEARYSLISVCNELSEWSLLLTDHCWHVSLSEHRGAKPPGNREIYCKK